MIRHTIVVAAYALSTAFACAQEAGGGAFDTQAFGAVRSDVTIGPRLIVPFGPGADAPLRQAELRFGAQWAPAATAPLSTRAEIVSLGWQPSDGFALRAVGAPLTGPSGLYAETAEGHATHNRGLIVAGALLATGGAVLLVTELWDETKDTAYCAGEIILEAPNDDPVSCER